VSQSSSERARSSGITAKANSAGSEQVESLVDLLHESVSAHAARPLFASKRDGHWVEMTYREFDAAVDALRAALWALGVGPGDRVGIIAGNRVEWAVAAYASYGLGAAFVPMYESQQEKEWAFIVQDSGMKVLFVATREIHQKFERLRASLPRLEHVIVLAGTELPLNYTSLLRQGEAAPVGAVRPAPGDTAAVLYTPGTPGERIGRPHF
jgi:long-chain acyl-CoA synthetase